MKTTLLKSQRVISFRVLLVAVLALTVIQCRDIGLEQTALAKISVYVHWGATPIPQKKVELLQTRESRLTDENGLAEFELPAGKYVVRVYGINRGGPVTLYVDFDVEITTSQRRTLDVVDCIPCV